MATLLGRLAKFGSLISQGELLCTQGLTYLLREYPEVRSAFGQTIGQHAGMALPADMNWHAEQRQPDGGRPDLEGRVGDAAIVKGEAKLTAPFAPGQLRSYASDLVTRAELHDREGVVVVLVPSSRAQSAQDRVRAEFGFVGSAPWRRPELDGKTVTFAVLSWEDVLSTFGGLDSERLRAELEQFEGMYREFGTEYIAPLANREALIDWRNREDVFVKLVDAITRLLTKTMTSQARPYPFYVESSGEQLSEELDTRGYRLRYVCPLTATKPTCFSIGVRDPFAGYASPVWLRFHQATGRFNEVRDRLKSSDYRRLLVESEGHIWLPLDVPVGAEQDEMIRSLVISAQAIWQVARPPQT